MQGVAPSTTLDVFKEWLQTSVKEDGSINQERNVLEVRHKVGWDHFQDHEIRDCVLYAMNRYPEIKHVTVFMPNYRMAGHFMLYMHQTLINDDNQSNVRLMNQHTLQWIPEYPMASLSVLPMARRTHFGVMPDLIIWCYPECVDIKSLWFRERDTQKGIMSFLYKTLVPLLQLRHIRLMAHVMHMDDPYKTEPTVTRTISPMLEWFTEFFQQMQRRRILASVPEVTDAIRQRLLMGYYDGPTAQEPEMSKL